MDGKSEQDFTLDCSHWIKYLNVIEKYINGYAGLFQSLQMYKEDKLGHALGLVISVSYLYKVNKLSLQSLQNQPKYNSQCENEIQQ